MMIRVHLILGLVLIAFTALCQVPTISSFTPDSGPTGASVTITGTNFSATPANNVVYFGATRATVTAATVTQLTVTVPAGASPQPISVLVGGLVANSAKPFIVTFNGVGITATSFTAQTNFTAGSGSQSISIGDLDGDGKADLVTANNFASSLSVLRNTSTIGTVSFAAKTDFAYSIPTSVSIADVDGDGKQDMIATSANLNVVSVYRNTSTVGTISFATKVDFNTGPNPQAIAFGDMDGDGKMDLVVSNGNSSTVSVLRNTGTIGTISFAAKLDMLTGVFGLIPYIISIGDLDGDGKVDLAIANSNNSIGIIRNTSTPGALSFSATVNFAAGVQPRSLAIGDLDGDGKADLAVTNSSDNTISLFRNTSTAGTISFVAKVDITASSGPYSVSFGDINGDGLIDMAVANANSNTVSVFGNTSTVGSISFAARSDFATNTGPRSVALGDLDGDGKLELFAGSNVSLVSVHRNIIKINQSIAFGALPTKTFGDASFTLTATSSSALPVSYTSSNTSVATVTANMITIVGAGVTTITASQAGDATYAAAANVQQVLTVNKANQSITFGAIANKTFGNAPFTLAATSSSSLPVNYTSSNTSVATVSGNTVTIVGAGVTTITASQAGNANYNPATDVPQSLTVNKANQGITFGALVNKTFGDPAFTLAATASSGLVISYSSSNTAVAMVTGNIVTVVGVGATTITASQAGNANYNPATDVPQSLTVIKANQTITFGSLANKTFGDAAFGLTATASSSLTVSYTSSNTAVATVSGNTLTILGAGTTTITASQSGNTNINAAIDVQQTLAVGKADQTITFTALPNKTVGDAPFALGATASSGLPVAYTSSNLSVATVSGGIVTIVGLGATTITATQAGNSNFNPATDLLQAFSVKENQVITFAALPDKAMGDAAFTLAASATSGLPVAFSTSSSNITIAGNAVTIVGAGRATVTAAQSGDNDFHPAPTVDQSFCVKPAKPIITFTNSNTATPTLTSSASVGNQWYFNGSAITGATSTALQVSQPGLYKVQAHVDDCISDFSNDQSLVITGDIQNKLTSIAIYPNPVSDWLTVLLGHGGGKNEVSIHQVNGIRIESQEISTDEARFHLTKYSPGMYIVKVTSETSVTVMRFIKQ